MSLDKPAGEWQLRLGLPADEFQLRVVQRQVLVGAADGIPSMVWSMVVSIIPCTLSSFRGKHPSLIQGFGYLVP